MMDCRCIDRLEIRFDYLEMLKMVGWLDLKRQAQHSKAQVQAAEVAARFAQERMKIVEPRKAACSDYG